MAVNHAPRVWVACYDVSDDRIRTRVQRVFERYGWRYQLSVFLIVAPAEQARQAVHEAAALLRSSDRILLAALDEGVPGWVVGYPLEAAVTRLSTPLVTVAEPLRLVR